MLLRTLCSRARALYNHGDSVCSGVTRAALWRTQGSVRGWSSSSNAKPPFSVGILGAPFSKGQRKGGVTEGPKAIRATGVLQELKESGLDVKDYGDVLPENQEDTTNPSRIKDEGPSGERNHQAVLTYNRLLSQRVSQVLQEGRVCVTLGGDHSTAIGTIQGHAKADTSKQVVVLWVDAHADINTGATSGSGNMHGMPVAHHLSHLAHGIAPLPDGFPQPCLSSSHVAYVGLRDVDPGERTYLNKLGIMNYGVRDVDRLGITEVMARCLDHLDPGPNRPLHLSYDIDVLDPREAPSTGTPVRGGLSLREGMVVGEVIHAGGHIGAMDLVEVNPSLGSPEDALITASAAKLILVAALVG